ncbi:outer membrane protein assembly factor BamD [Porphyromonas sp.]|uniref:outer membrane protein assembly factor BamD n=1 Tax=Porphyromonas sp. TaxID=1924944 RepID=UPI003AB1865F
MTRQTLLRILVLSCWLLCTSSCAEYMRIQKSKDPTLRYSYAKKYYNEGKYSRVAELMVDVLPHYEGTQEGAQALYIMADALLQNKQESSAAEYFRRLYSKYPQDARAAEARYKTGLALYRIAPDPRLDQSITYSALKELQGFLEAYPQSEHRKEVEQMLFDLQDNLAKKELITADLYYNLGTYIGNNYISAIITARNALKAYPYTKHREDLLFIIVEASYQQAINSVESKKQGRLREVIDAYYNYENAFPNGKHLKRAKALRDRAQRMIVS